MDCLTTVSPQSLRSISIYESRLLILIIGQCFETKRHHVLEIKRSVGSLDVKQEMILHTQSYSFIEKDNLVASSKCVSIISDAFCIFGFINLVESCYIIVVTKASVVGSIHGHDIYTITETNLIPVTYKVRNTMEESRYKSILQNFNLASQEFYFSYSYDLAKSMQVNCTHKNHSEKNINIDKFIWNYHTLKVFLAYHTGYNQDAFDETGERGELEKNPSMDRWIVPVIHGFFKQRIIRSSSHHTLKYTLLARRSRIFAGTRYLRRGIDLDGYTANEVETEQIVTEEEVSDCSYRSSSLIQIRGSIPLYWYHTNLFVPSPDIKLNVSDYGYNAAVKHFHMLKCVYGDNITVLNLVRLQNSSREMTVGGAYKELVTALNSYYDTKSGDANQATHESISHCISSGENKKGGSDRSAPNTSNDGKSTKQAEDTYMEKNENNIQYVAYDFHGSLHSNLFNDLGTICAAIAPASGFFVQAPEVRRNHNAKDGEESSPKGLEGTDHRKIGIMFDGRKCRTIEESGDNETDKDRDVGKEKVKEKNIKLKDGDYTYSSWPLSSSQDEPGSGDSDTVLRSLFIQHPLGKKLSKLGNIDVDQNDETPLGNLSGNMFDVSRNVPELEETSENKELGRGVCGGVLQMGVLRTNCVDCLDRTNVAQFCYARHCLHSQIKALGVHFSSPSMREFEAICSEIWSQHGDALAHQYGGSGAMHSLSATTSSSSSSSSSLSVLKMIQSISATLIFSPSVANDYTTATSTTTTTTTATNTNTNIDINIKKPISFTKNSTRSTLTATPTSSVSQLRLSSFLPTWGLSSSSTPQEGGEREFVLSGGAKNALVAVQRYYSNIATDFERQQSIDLLLGLYLPSRGNPPLWDADMYAPTMSRGDVNYKKSSSPDSTTARQTCNTLVSSTIDKSIGEGYADGDGDGDSNHDKNGIGNYNNDNSNNQNNSNDDNDDHDDNNNNYYYNDTDNHNNDDDDDNNINYDNYNDNNNNDNNSGNNGESNDNSSRRNRKISVNMYESVQTNSRSSKEINFPFRDIHFVPLWNKNFSPPSSASFFSSTTPPACLTAPYPSSTSASFKSNGRTATVTGTGTDNPTVSDNIEYQSNPKLPPSKIENNQNTSLKDSSDTSIGKCSCLQESEELIVVLKENDKVSDINHIDENILQDISPHVGKKETTCENNDNNDDNIEFIRLNILENVRKQSEGNDEFHVSSFLYEQPPPSFHKIDENDTVFNSMYHWLFPTNLIQNQNLK